MPPQRLLTGVAGTLLALLGLASRSKGGTIVALAGGVLACRAFGGHDDLGAVLRRLGRGGAGRRRQAEAAIDEALDESFPASDPPSWTAGGAHLSGE